MRNSTNPPFSSPDEHVERAPPSTLSFAILGVVAIPGSAVRLTVTSSAERDEVLLGIVSGVAAKLFVMDFQVGHRAARLTSPAIPTEHLLSEILVRHPIQPPALGLRANWAHDAFSLKPSRNSCRCYYVVTAINSAGRISSSSNEVWVPIRNDHGKKSASRNSRPLCRVNPVAI
jgi:hypothetical protein